MRTSITLNQTAQENLAKLKAQHPMASRSALLGHVLNAGFEALLGPVLVADGLRLHPQPFPPLEAIAQQMAAHADASDWHEQPISSDNTCPVAGNPFTGE